MACTGMRFTKTSARTKLTVASFVMFVAARLIAIVSVTATSTGHNDNNNINRDESQLQADTDFRSRDGQALIQLQELLDTLQSLGISSVESSRSSLNNNQPSNSNSVAARANDETLASVSDEIRAMNKENSGSEKAKRKLPYRTPTLISSFSPLFVEELQHIGGHQQQQAIVDSHGRARDASEDEFPAPKQPRTLQTNYDLKRVEGSRWNNLRGMWGKRAVYSPPLFKADL